MNICVSQYKDRVKRNLSCCSSAKARLLAKLDTYLEFYLDEHSSPTVDDLINAFGPPEEMSKVLMNELSANEVQNYHKFVIIKRTMAAMLLGVLILFTAYIFFIKEYNNITIIEEAIINETLDVSETQIIAEESN